MGMNEIVHLTSFEKCLYLPSVKRFTGYDPEAGELNADILRNHLFGGHVAGYMRLLQEEDEEKYKAHFSRYIKEGVTADNVRGNCLAFHFVTIYICERI